MGERLADVRLVLFFTRGLSLRAWDEIGILQRETALYRRLEPALRRITLVTYGDRDQVYANRLGGVTLQCNRWHLRSHLYERYLRRVLPWSWIGPVVVKSNQVQGADIALAAARLANKPFIARCGYLPSDNMECAHGAGSPQAKQAESLERLVFSGADRVVVTTDAIRQKIFHRYQLRPECVRVIPNYVDTELFAPAPSQERRPNRLLYVGRLDAEKNPRALFEAVEGMDAELVMVGKGSLAEGLAREAAERRLPVRFLGNLPNHELPRLLNSATAFVMPSLIEGHPKALLEAMACGVPVIGTNVAGIRQLIRHRETGYLSDCSPDGLRSAIGQVLADRGLRCRMGMAARAYIEEQFSLEKILDLETSLLDEVSQTSKAIR
jgi:glycosyltransferase involved in cell wall biosynthesis